MARLLRLTLVVLGAWVLTQAPGAHASDRLDSRSAKERPVWLTSTPPPDRGALFFVGVKTGALTLEEGSEGAYRSAAGQIASYIRERISSKTLGRKTNLENRFVDELRASSHGNLQGAAVKDLYWERVSLGHLLFRKLRYDVWALIEYPKSEVFEERARLETSDGEFDRKLTRLCQSAAGFLRSRKPSPRVQVSGFKEAASQERFPLSRILEGSLSVCLSSHGFRTVSAGPADFLVAGEYWKGPGFVSLSLRLSAGRDTAILHASEERLSLDSVEPLWLSGEEGDTSDFFAGPDQASAMARELTGSIKVKTTPPGARVFVDGVDRGVSPTVILGVEPGIRSVAISLQDHEPHSEEVTIRPNEKASVGARLVRETGLLTVRSSPPGARVLINGEPRGTTPLKDLELPTGRYEVSLKLKDHKEWRDSLTLGYREAKSLDPDLQEEDGSLFILVQPLGADIRLDDSIVGQSSEKHPVKLRAVASGQHTVAAYKEGFATQSWQVRVRPNQTVSVTGSLAQAPTEREYRPVPRIEPEPDSWYSRRDRSLAEPPAWVRWLGKIDRPQRMTYANAFGVTVGGGMVSYRLMEFSTYFWNSRVGIGTCIICGYSGKFMMNRTDTKMNYGQRTVASQSVPLDMVTFFPAQAYFVPFAHSYSAFGHKLVASAQFYVLASAWAAPMINDGVVPQSSESGPPNGTVLDYGIMLHPGALAGLRIGTVQTGLRGFTYGDSSYSSMREKRFYVAADLSLGWFFAGTFKENSP